MDPTLAPPDGAAAHAAAPAPPPADQETTTPADARGAFALPGGRISGYEIAEPIGRGGMGVVYRARQQRPNRIVALKLLRADLISPALLRRFEYEAEVLGRLQHEGIAQIYEAGVDAVSGRPFFAMELVEGERLDAFVARTKPGLPERLRLLMEICRAVHYAHQRGVIHRDLKPGNILVTCEGKPKVLDFGVARLTDADVQAATLHTETGVIVGALAYMAPEQASGAHEDVDTRADIYALGVIAYELLAGRLPLVIAGKPLPAAVRAIVEEEPSRLSSVDRSLRGDLDTIVGKALAKEKSHRYDSAAALAEDVRRFLEYEPIVARRPSTWYNLRKFARRNKVLVSGVAASFLILLAGVATTTGFAVRASRQAEIARRQAERATHAEAAAIAQRDEARRQQRAVRETNDFLVGMFNEADPANARGRDVTAVEIVERALEQLDYRFDDEPFIKAWLQGNLAYVLVALGKAAQAEPLLRQAVAECERELGADHGDTLQAMNNLAYTLQSLGRTAEAVPLYRRALEGRERVLGPDHPDTLLSIHNLAYGLQAQNDLKTAEPLYRRAVAERERVLGPDHADTLASINNLAGVVQAQGKTAEAAALVRRAMDGLERRLGPDHPDTLQAMNNLAFMLNAVGKPGEAEPLFRRALVERERVLGPDHPDTLLSVHNLGFGLQALGNSAEAETLYRRAFDGRRRVLGAGHTDTLVSEASVARALIELRRAGEAGPLAEEAFTGLRTGLGVDHPYTKVAASIVARLYDETGRLAEAAALRREFDLPMTAPATRPATQESAS